MFPPVVQRQLAAPMLPSVASVGVDNRVVDNLEVLDLVLGRWFVDRVLGGDLEAHSLRQAAAGMKARGLGGPASSSGSAAPPVLIS